ncbi:MAG: hypothetical protein AVDCRST_MAG06-1772, partial [uncultured Nocardioides sp.]
DLHRTLRRTRRPPRLPPDHRVRAGGRCRDPDPRRRVPPPVRGVCGL